MLDTLFRVFQALLVRDLLISMYRVGHDTKLAYDRTLAVFLTHIGQDISRLKVYCRVVYTCRSPEFEFLLHHF
jgi:hypothetical protein